MSETLTKAIEKVERGASKTDVTTTSVHRRMERTESTKGSSHPVDKKSHL